MKINNASGYGGLDGTPLIRNEYSDVIMANIFERDFISEITNTSIDEDIISQYQSVSFIKQPFIAPWRPYEVNQTLIPDQISPDSDCLSIDKAIYKLFKFDKLTIQRINDRWDAWENSFLDATSQSLTAGWRAYLLSNMLGTVGPRTRGTQAGTNRDINLGAVGNPVSLTADNIAAVLANIQRALSEQNGWEDGKMFILVPPAFYAILMSSDFANVCHIGGNTSIAVDGLLTNKLLGFKVIESNHVPYYKDATTGTVTYSLIAGHSDAVGWGSNIIEADVAKATDSFGVYYKLLAVHGCKTFYPDMLASAYVTIS